MFVTLTTTNSIGTKTKKVYININEIRTFELSDVIGHPTVVYLKYGNILVKETPEEILQMVKGEK